MSEVIFLKLQKQMKQKNPKQKAQDFNI